MFAPKLTPPLPLPVAEAEAAELEPAALEAPEVDEWVTVTPKPLDEETGAVADTEPELEPVLEPEFETVSVAEAEPEEAADVEEVELIVAGFGPI